MSTLILQTAGKAIGGAIAGPLGAMVGGALGASAGYAFDQRVFGEARSVNRQGPRLSDLQVQTSTQGADIPRAYGRVRLNGQIIWATNYIEKVTTRTEKTGGGKAGGAPQQTTTQTTYSYYANFAVGLCEGEIGHIGRIWANGTLLDLETITYRVYRGAQDQMPDSLIEAKQGSGQAPAYRGLAYIVFEELPLADFGNRIPQLSFEIVKPVGQLEKQITSMVMLPGATEFGYDTQEVKRTIAEGQQASENKHSLEAGADFEVSLEHLLAICPNLKRIALVIAWFGSDLRASHCAIEPKVDSKTKQTSGGQWSVAGLDRSDAKSVSKIDNRAAYGGTPSDQSILNAISFAKEKGLEVVLYPFVMMDIPLDNQLPDPYGAPAQAAFPWRGRITCHPAAGEENTADKTDLATSQLNHFYSEQDWSYRKFILHYAALANQAGGVSGFLLGSELRGLTQVRNEAGDYPFVSHLKALAAEVRSHIGPQCKLTYGADWSEYFGHHPKDEQGTVSFHLDPLWADENINAIGIDNYMPMSDWRAESPNRDGEEFSSVYDPDYLKSRITSGEGYDWYYASDEHRKTQNRTPITDGAHNKPWVFRYKDLKNWWSNPHFNRNEGTEASQSTEWQPRSKPIWFTELGCAAVHLGSNQPNRFPDPKSSEHSLPYGSSGARDDAMQRTMLDAVLGYWRTEEGKENPISPLYNAPMVDVDHSYLWAWDARPFPSFPLQTDSWSDGRNWFAGHWLNGRLGTAPAQGLIKAVFADFGLPEPKVEVPDLVLDGFVIDRRMSARAALETLSDAFGLSILASKEPISFQSKQTKPIATITDKDLVDLDNQASNIKSSAPAYAHVSSLSFGYQDVLLDFRQSVARRDWYGSKTGTSRNEKAIALSVCSSLPEMELQAENWLRREAYGRHRVQMTLPPSYLALEAGDCITANLNGEEGRYVIEEIEDGEAREIEARKVPLPSEGKARSSSYQVSQEKPLIASKPVAECLYLPVLPGRSNHGHAPYLAVHADPWPGSVHLYEGSPDSGFRHRQILSVPAIMGRLNNELSQGLPDRWDRQSSIEVSLLGGELSSVPDEAVLNGANSAAILAKNGEWEILQFAKADLIAPKTWRLSGLLRGQLGTEQAALVGADTQSRFVLLDEAIVPLEVPESRLEQVLQVRLVPHGSTTADSNRLDLEAAIDGRGLKPYAPVHLERRIDHVNGLWTFGWIRRDRLNADSWVGHDIRMSEEIERYS
ncbi:MAG: glycoside hydrolase/phage tail family protein, partial [Cohaesibacter sp.]|nr:glycoside hydrolase/phage tail family protein [Cohaesibacter sp.]